MTSGIPEQIWANHMRLLFWLRFIEHRADSNPSSREFAEWGRIEQHVERT